MGGRREPNEYDLIWLIKHGREWVENLQDRYRPLAHPLPGPLKARWRRSSLPPSSIECRSLRWA